jgi:hypothetical protein
MAMAWAVNGVLSVAGSVLAVTVAAQFGISNVIPAGCVAHVLAAATASATPASNVSTPEA